MEKPCKRNKCIGRSGVGEKQVEYCDLYTLPCVWHQDIIFAYFRGQSVGICPTHEQPVLIRQYNQMNSLNLCEPTAVKY